MRWWRAGRARIYENTLLPLTFYRFHKKDKSKSLFQFFFCSPLARCGLLCALLSSSLRVGVGWFLQSFFFLPHLLPTYIYNYYCTAYISSCLVCKILRKEIHKNLYNMRSRTSGKILRVCVRVQSIDNSNDDKG